MRRVSSLVCVTACLLLANVVHAEGDVVAAADAYGRAQRAELKGEYRRAAHLYELADQIAPSVQALRSAARARFAAGERSIAATHAVELQRRYPRDADSKRIASRLLNSLRATLARFAISCAFECSLASNGRAVTTRRSRSHVIFVAPGQHEFVARFGAGERHAIRVNAKAGTEVRVSLAPPPLAAPPPLLPRVASSSTTSDLAVVPPKSRSSRGFRPRWFWMAGVLTVGLGAGAVWSGLETLGHQADYDSDPTEAGYQEGVDLERRTNILLGVTALAGVTTILLAMTTNWSRTEQRVRVSAGASGVLVSFGGGF